MKSNAYVTVILSVDALNSVDRTHTPFDTIDLAVTKTMDMDAVIKDRLADRRARLQRLSDVDPVRQQLRIGSYYNLARQLYRQSETYYREGALDNAYVFMARFIK
ncbi:hypothetical protein PINS_up001757 [Pythium insidiosum]|nr:hypothetical protein PINS_up001757 [Pythium insidiosum]